MREKSSVLATERLLEIRGQFATVIQRLVPVELDGETLRLILYLEDGTNLRVTEQWLERRSGDTVTIGLPLLMT